jgi:hypothetical protein
VIDAMTVPAGEGNFNSLVILVRKKELEEPVSYKVTKHYGGSMKSRAAVAWEAGKPLVIE